MNIAVKLGAFAAMLAVVVAASFAVGRAVGPIGSSDDGDHHAPAVAVTPTTEPAGSDHAGHG